MSELGDGWSSSSSAENERRCRVCGGVATFGWPDGWYCSEQGACIEQREWGRRLDPAAPLAPSRSCAPTRCYCGSSSCSAAASYRLTVPAVELWRGQLHVAAHESRAVTLERRMLRNAEQRQLPRAERIRAEWDTRDEETWIDRM